MSKTADAIIVPTAAVCDEVINYLGASEQKVFVIAEAAREFFEPVAWSGTGTARKKFGIGDHFILTVGTIEPRKNLATLVSAFERLSPEKNLQLVIVGGQGWLSTPSLKAIEQSPARARIVMTDYLHDEDLRSLYSSCRVFVYPSLYEGFGLPPIEAMACGAPVVTSDIRSLVESTGGVAKVAAPQDPAAFTKVIQSLLENEEERRQLSAAGRARAAELTWQDAARKTLDVYERVLSN
jgi:glycosyltransferase involved in cell wall biosynthesis